MMATCIAVEAVCNIEQIICHLLFRGFTPNNQVWNKHGDDGENKPTHISMHSVQENRHETVEETTIPEIVHETKHEGVNEIMQETLAADDVIDTTD